MSSAAVVTMSLATHLRWNRYSLGEIANASWI